MPKPDDSGQAIRIAAGGTFTVRLAGNPSTGYLWEPEADAELLTLSSQDFEPDAQAPGAGGQEVFHFRALAAGETQLTFTYRRPWDKKARQTRRFEVTIT